MDNEEKPEKENVLTLVENIHGALENKDITKVVEIICKKTNAQRQSIKEFYLSNYGTDLIKELESKLPNDVKSLILGLMMTPEDFDANEIAAEIPIGITEVTATIYSENGETVTYKIKLLNNANIRNIK